MELNHLRYFYEVAKSGSFTEAARRLRVSQSALSKAVGLLEDHESVRLFHRSKRGVALTSIGSEIFSKCESVFQALSEVEVTFRGRKDAYSGFLRIGASDHIVNYLLVPKVIELRQQHPEVISSLFSGTPNSIIELLLKNEVDFGLFFTKISAPGINYTPLLEVPMAIVCHPRIVLAANSESGSATRVKTLLRTLDIIGSGKNQYQHHPSKDFLESFRAGADFAYESNNQEAQKRLCLAGGGIAYLARFMVEAEIESGDLVEIPIKNPISLQLVLATPKGRELNLGARDFLSRTFMKKLNYFSRGTTTGV